MKYFNKFMMLFFLSLSISLFSVSDLQCRDAGFVPVFPRAVTNPTILLVGTFYPAEMHPKGNVITVKIREKKFYFKIKLARNLHATGSAYSIISNLLPPELKLIGADETIAPLMKKNIFGKEYSLRGTIYAADNLMHLDMVMQGNLFDKKRKSK